MTTLERYQDLKAKADKRQRRVDKAAGALEHQMAQLKADFDCDDIESARKLSKKLTHKAVEDEEVFATATEAFEEKWGEILDNE